MKPTLVENWEQLATCTSDIYDIKIDTNGACGWIMKKAVSEGKLFEKPENVHYLSTHTFYESQYKHATKVLQECGFNVELVSWG